MSGLTEGHFISNLTNHELQKKLANQKRPCDSAGFELMFCTNLQQPYTEGLECL